MRVAALYDIHGNLLALEAVLEDIRQADVDQIVIGGMSSPVPCHAKRLCVCWTSTCPHTSFTAMANWLPWPKWRENGPDRSLTGGRRQARVLQKVLSISIDGLWHSCSRNLSRCWRAGLKRFSLRLMASARRCFATVRHAAKQRSSTVSRLKTVSCRSLNRFKSL